MTNGQEDLFGMLNAGPAARFGSSEEIFLKCGASLETLLAVKRKSKGLYREAANPDARLAALLGYFLSTAAAVVHHGSKISVLPAEEFLGAYRKLAAVTSGRLRELFRQAEERLSTGGGAEVRNPHQ